MTTARLIVTGIEPGCHVSAIKAIRNLGTLGLKEAKEFIDAPLPAVLLTGKTRDEIVQACGELAAGGVRYIIQDYFVCGIANPGGIPCTKEKGHPEGHDPASYGPEQKVSKGYVVRLLERPRQGAGSIVRAIWDAAPRQSGDLLPLTNLIKNLPAEVLSTTDKLLATRLKDSLLAFGCKVEIRITKLGVPAIHTAPLGELREADAYTYLVNVVGERELKVITANSLSEARAKAKQLYGRVRYVKQQLPEIVNIGPAPSGRVFTEYEFLAHMAALHKLYCEGEKDDDPDWLAHLGSLEGGAVDFAKFVEALGGEVSEPCSVCSSKGFLPSATGKGCKFCDGSFSGNPPSVAEPGK